ncbi:hypothetical protein KDM41_12660 [bacterium]|nr:hypothetical protein [bacterium]
MIRFALLALHRPAGSSVFALVGACLLLAGLMPLAAGPAVGQCVGYPMGDRVLNSVDGPGMYGAILLDGDQAVAMSATMLGVFDFSDPDLPAPQGWVDLGDLVSDLDRVGDLVYAPVAFYGLRIVDVSDPAVPTIIGQVATGSEGAAGVAVAGSWAYLAAASTGLQVVDVSNPAAPALTATIPVDGIARNIRILGEYAYLAAGDYMGSHIHVYDISVPGSPALVHTLDTPGSADRITFDAPMAYVSQAWSLLVLDLTAPALPVIVGSLAVPTRDVAVVGDVAYLAADQSDLLVVNIADPALPAVVDHVETNGFGGHVAAAGDRIYLCASDLHVITAVPAGAADSLSATATAGRAVGVSVLGDRVCVADSTGGLSVFDAADPSAPVLLGSLPLPGPAVHAVQSGDHAFVACEAGGLQIVDLADPALPVIVGEIAADDAVNGVTVRNERLYVADGSAGLRIFDITNPAVPVPLGTFANGQYCENVLVDGGRAYITGTGPGLQIVVVADPAKPIEMGGSPTGYAWDVALKGDHAFVATAQGLVVVDVSSPAAPAIVAGLPTARYVTGISVFGDHAYLAAGPLGTLVCDISTPTVPKLSGQGSTGDSACFLEFMYPVLTVADGAGGLRILPLSCPDGLAPDCDLNGVPDDEDIALDPGRDWNGDGILDSCQQGQELSGVGDLPNPRLAIAEAWPNPFNPKTTVALSLAKAGVVKVRICDVRGRTVRTLAGGIPLDAGRHEFTWNGLTDAGGPAASGVYYCIAESGRERATRALALIK